ncbi:hypothetical protein RUM43_000539 [Polyplax serrata]|uniref:Uncharacterized protein n=1 Tax=Polyplax serrata TaxID=468196 RepID=A0AAN8SG72_POLSC
MQSSSTGCALLKGCCFHPSNAPHRTIEGIFRAVTAETAVTNRVPQERRTSPGNAAYGINVYVNEGLIFTEWKEGGNSGKFDKWSISQNGIGHFDCVAQKKKKKKKRALPIIYYSPKTGLFRRIRYRRNGNGGGISSPPFNSSERLERRNEKQGG